MCINYKYFNFQMIIYQIQRKLFGRTSWSVVEPRLKVKHQIWNHMHESNFVGVRHGMQPGFSQHA